MMCVLFSSDRNDRKYKLTCDFITFIFLNMDISVPTLCFDLTFSVCNPNILLKGQVFQNVDVGLSSCVM